MTDNKMTPEQFVREWLPEYQEKRNAVFDSLDEVVRFYTNAHQLDDCVVCAYFHEALEAFARHVWDQACRDQREECCENLLIGGIDSIAKLEQKHIEMIIDLIDNAPISEFKITEK